MKLWYTALAALLTFGVSAQLLIISGGRGAPPTEPPPPADDSFWSDILAPERAKDWTLAGIPGGIPSRTTICTTVASGASSATIQTAINNCPVGQVVQLSAGTYTSVNINWAKGIVLRGAGANSTTLSLSDNIIMGSGTSWIGTWPASPAVKSWTGGLTQGSTVITVNNNTGLSVGQTIILDETNPPWVTTAGNAGDCGSSNTCGRSDAPGFGGGGDNRASTHMTVIEAINGTSITIRDPVTYTHSAARTPQLFYWSGPGNIVNAGIENLTIDANSTDYAINMAFCTYCWVRGVRVDEVARAGVQSYYGYGNELRDSYLSSTAGGAPTQYGVESVMSGNFLVENNIFWNVTSPMMPEASSGLVYGYNYAHSIVSSNLFASIAPHLAHNNFILIEGNDVDKIQYDNVWASGSHGTIYRNRVNGLGENKLGYRVPIGLAASQWYMNAVANVLGTLGYHVTYECSSPRITPDTYIWDLGYVNDCPFGGTYQAGTKATLMRWGNWDARTYVLNGSTNGVRYCTGSGAGNAACTEDEDGSGSADFPALASPLTTFPASFYHDDKPAFFASDDPWPPIGPDVTCSVDCVANAGNKANKIPARQCYEASPKNGTGYLTAFDPQGCYGTP